MTAQDSASRPGQWLTAYYGATPLFALADWLGANVRAVGLAHHPEWRMVYYAACMGLGALMVLRPAWAAALTIAESSVNVLLLILAVVLPLYDLIGALAAGGVPQAPPFTPQFFVNFLISGGILVGQFYRAQAGLIGR